MEVNISFFIQLAIFVVLYLWLRAVLFKPLLKTLDEREARIEGASEEAIALSRSNERIAEEIDERMSAASADARALLLQLRNEGRQIERDTMESARLVAQKEIALTKEEISKLKLDIDADIDAQAAQLAQVVIGSALGREGIA